MIERAGYVDVHKLLPPVGCNMKLVQRGGVENHLHPLHTTHHDGPI
jgi:hypothetical protein